MRPLVTNMDARRLRSLLATPVARQSPLAASLLERKLLRAAKVPTADVPRTIMTMNARARCRGAEDGRERELTLVYPWASAPGVGRVSILSAPGVELLGATPGDLLVLGDDLWQILDVAFQPEAEALFHL